MLQYIYILTSFSLYLTDYQFLDYSHTFYTTIDTIEVEGLYILF